jgi:hypothetical protein
MCISKAPELELISILSTFYFLLIPSVQVNHWNCYVYSPFLVHEFSIKDASKVASLLKNSPFVVSQLEDECHKTVI